MTFENLNDNHIDSAARLALAEYFEEQSKVPVLPDGNFFDTICGSISEMIGHKLGIVAIENGNVVGFLTCYKPWDQHFGKTMGTFSPIHAHGAARLDRRRIYSLLYQAAAEKWVKQGILSHAVALYAHDEAAVTGFFRNGFGLRCIDAIRPVESIACDVLDGYTFCELQKEDIYRLVPLKNGLIGHLRSTPSFIPLPYDFDEKQVREQNEKRRSRYFVANDNDSTVAFIEVMPSGENFACDDPGMMNICGAYMMPEYRGTGIYTKLLSYLMETLEREGYSRCGVDYESLNPTASGFWMKYFTEYTYSVTRRIDERITSFLY